jgi:lipoprotein-anchoring transpeptidase ErfK/SrfK
VSQGVSFLRGRARVAGGYLKMGPKTMATSSKGAFSVAVVSAACLRGKGAWLGATAIGLICLSGTTKPADAGFLFGDTYSSSYYGYGGYGGGMNVASRSYGHRRSSGSNSDSGASTGTGANAGASKGQAKQEPPKPPAGPLIIVVSIGSQHVTVYDDGTPIMSGPVSTGMPGHPTPMGIFSVIQKDRYHHSNIYSGAPMPYMQRITWSGVAMHEGVVPGHPASHGCIRLTHDFAARLWTTTKMGVRVIVSPRNDVVPQQFDHPSLVALATKPATPDVAAPAPAPSPTLEKTELPLPTYSSLAPPALPGQPRAALGEGLDASGDSALPAPEAVTLDQQPGDMHPAVAQALPSTAPVTAPAPVPAAPAVFEKPLKPGLLSVFVSRKTGKLYVRKGNEPVFDMPITISHPEQPIGTYLFTAGRADDNGKLRWLASNVASGKANVDPPKKVVGRRGSRQPEVVEAPAPVSPTSAAEALDRVQIPQEALDRIAPLVTPGASLIVSDLGMSGETGKDTDFIILAR